MSGDAYAYARVAGTECCEAVGHGKAEQSRWDGHLGRCTGSFDFPCGELGDILGGARGHLTQCRDLPTLKRMYMYPSSPLFFDPSALTMGARCILNTVVKKVYYAI